MLNSLWILKAYSVEAVRRFPIEKKIIIWEIFYSYFCNLNVGLNYILSLSEIPTFYVEVFFSFKECKKRLLTKISGTIFAQQSIWNNTMFKY